ncbi:phosphoenolpyruvate--protein phosphotransferase [Hydromonas duriensis]|uniref:Phosphoenolpyruvate-protein phosphotransferase n=1 Tax=Hydromonas duriensis TaxID=1527608 RepID=A0A4V3DK76_9BURK|nr:phosphoenolpyruvate--protein phosphotransferase [Hydromonas duriensis]TDR32980.1 phosphoenolpyruvate--protein phosphotransferase [Hydromonas duriensis]
MTFSIHGIGVSEKIAIGKAHLLAHVSLEAPHYLVAPERVDAEIARFELAVRDVHEEFMTLQAGLDDDAPNEMNAMLQVHAMIAQDSMLVEVPKVLMRNKRYNAEWALSTQVNELVEQFEAFEDPYLRERKQDVMQVGTRIMRAIREHSGLLAVSKEQPQAFDSDMILVAHDITPADMLQFKDRDLAGFITDLGGTTSHTAIVARGLGVPAVVATGQARDLIRENEWVIVDGESGVVLVNPTELLLEHYRQLQAKQRLHQASLGNLVHQRAKTLDDWEIKLLANIELPSDVAALKEVGADGVGLFRSEFLFLNRRQLPDEEEQLTAYKTVAEGLLGKSVTIRTLDIGADKGLDTDEYVTPLNPALGLRAIRYSLAHPDMFLTQLRAILRASAFGSIKLLLPMISGLDELQQALELLGQARAQLKERKQAYDPDLPVGIMIEIPSSALILPALLPLIDFVSIGTNDLTQYTLAVDRGDAEVGHLYNETHPAVLQLIAHVIDTTHKAKKKVSVCGEMAGNAKLTRLFLGMGLREFSMQASQVLSVKERVLLASIKKSRKKANEILNLFEQSKINAKIKELNQKTH